MVSTFFARVARHFANEMAVVTPNGQLLSHDPIEGLAKWRKIAADERKRLDDLGEYNELLDPTPPRGGLILNVFARALVPGSKGQLQPYKTDVARSKEPGRDHLWLDQREVRSFVPQRAEVGAEQEVSPHLVERIARRYLIDLVRVGGNGGPRRPEEVLSASARLTVTKATAREIQLQLAGSTRVATHDAGSGAKRDQPKVDDYQLQGLLVYDRDQGRFTRFDLVGYSPTGHYDEIHEKTLPLVVAFVLSDGTTPADRLPPSSFGPDYFPAGKGS